MQPRFSGCRSVIDLVVTTMAGSWDRQIQLMGLAMVLHVARLAPP
jgi:hypothetical protein